MHKTNRHIIFRVILLAALLLGVNFSIEAQVNNSRLKSQLADYFQNYVNATYVNTQKYSILRVMTSESKRTVEVYANEAFGMQPFTPALVEDIYRHIRLRLPVPFNSYDLTIYANDKDIRELVTAAWTNTMGERRHWGNVEYKGLSWVQNTSMPVSFKGGLQGRHLSLWASHGKYYSNGEQKWMWQRPHLYCTTEDLLTQSIAVPFLYPMLERAGAVVFTPRERDWQRLEVVVDNDIPDLNGSYAETSSQYEWERHGTGFSNKNQFLTDFDDPHHEGTARIIPVVTNKRQQSQAIWTPVVPADGNYAVYVTYPVLPNAVPDAQYTIRHGGVKTTVRVNQQMGGSTWVYLGTFDFKAGHSAENSITLTNQSDYRGYVGADAIRLGGGMSNVVRADLNKQLVSAQPDTNDPAGNPLQPGSIIKPNGQIMPPGSGLLEHNDSLYQSNDGSILMVQYNYLNDLIGSGLPRHLEAARYTTQWMGLNRERFSVKDGTSDYGDDINARPIATNYLARGSVYLPGDSGLCVPLELNLALHSDAGYRREMEYIGTLGIYTTDVDGGVLPGGQNRLASRDFCDILLQQVTADIQRQYGQWTRRQLYDRNYGETRLPRIPSAILEMFSHQNYADMQRALDPVFKFRLSRSIYKGILRFVTLQHQARTQVTTPIVAPLPVRGMAVQADAVNHHIRVSWQPTIDPLEETAMPTSYIVYKRTKDSGWDNGVRVFETNYDFVPDDEQLYQFRVEAVNEGGRSMPSEVLCGRLSSNPLVPAILIVNGFQRLAGPQAVCSADSCGFDMLRDPGVSYIHTTEFCGRQLYFGWDGIGKESSNGMGYSGTELEGVLVKGNTFDYPVLHAEDYTAATDLNISSCSREALEVGLIQAGAYKIVDLILGAQREDGYSSLSYKTFTPELQQCLSNFTEGGGSLLVSGAYIGTDMTSPADRQFTAKVLHFTPGDMAKPTPLDDSQEEAAADMLTIEGMNTQCSYLMRPNEDHLSTAYVSTLTPDSHSFATLLYGNTHQCAATAYRGPDYNCISVGFPIEQIREADIRRNLMQGFLSFLLGN